MRLNDDNGVITCNNDWFIKGYLGNVRMVLSGEKQSWIYLAAMLEGFQISQSDAAYLDKIYFVRLY